MSFDPNITRENVQSIEDQLQADMERDLQNVCSVLNASTLEVTAETIYQHQTSDQAMQYTKREISRWLRG